jgi:hypothetical protein
MLNNAEVHTPFALAAYLVPALPVQHGTFATVATDPGHAFQHRALAQSGQQHCVAQGRFVSFSALIIQWCLAIARQVNAAAR